ncbi:FadR/GntR family transcriptional regulator [Corynebacterium sp. ZY180755]
MMRQPSASKMAAEGIVQYIRDNHLTHGDPLPSETVLCEALGCSRSSVREAMRTLSSLDIVEVRHGHGTYVSSMSLSPLIQGMILRVLLSAEESFANLTHIVDLRAGFDHSVATELIGVWEGRDIEPLLAIVDEMRAEHKAGRSWTEQDRKFHTSLLEPVSNPLMRELSDAFWEVHMTALPQMDMGLPEDVEITIEAHAAMVRALHSGEIERFHELVDTHYEPLRRAIALKAAKE